MLNRILDDARKKLVQDLRQKLGELRVALVRAEATEEAQKAVGRAIGQLDELFLLVVVGEFNAGKSAVINALVGERVLEEGPTPTTSRIQLVKHGSERSRTPAGGDYEEITLPVEILREMSVVDTPGTNAVVRGHEALTREFVPRSDLVLFVTSADRPFTETERTFLESIRDWGKKVVVAVNKTDILEKPDDVRKVVEFVRDKLRELLDLRPEVFAVSARQAWKTKAAGVAPDPATTGFGALEAYLTRTLDDAERLRVKLQSALGAVERAADGATEGVKSRLSLVTEDEGTLKEIDNQLLQQLQDQTRDFRLRLSEAERPIVELEKRGQAWLDETLRVTRAIGLLDADRTAAGFRHEVVAGFETALDKRVEGVVDALLAGEGRLWPALVERLERRRAAHGGRLAGTPVTAPAPDRAKPLQALTRDGRRALESFDASGFGSRLGRAARGAAWATLLLPLAAIGVAALAVARAESATSAMTGVVATAALVLAGFAPLSLLRRREGQRLAEAAAAVRQRFGAALRTGFERELDASQKRAQEAAAPFGRFVRSEAEKLRGQAYELGARRKDLDALQTRIAALR
ncbi:MAG TPA: dynamin family protein [Vicinamibacteria bacterium]|nr:dynamin family protein [Vicinamibacteria bacterium]